MLAATYTPSVGAVVVCAPAAPSNNVVVFVIALLVITAVLVIVPETAVTTFVLDKVVANEAVPLTVPDVVFVAKYPAVVIFL